MTKTIDFIFDFGSPNCYLARPLLVEIAKKHSAEIRTNPCLLGGIFKATGNQAPFVAFGNVPNKMAYEMLEMQRFIKKHGFDKFEMNPHFPVNTLAAMRCLVAALETGDGNAVMDAVGAAMWEDKVNIGDNDELAKVLRAAGLGAEDLLARAQTDPVKEKLKANTANAVERGAFGAPTYFIDDEMFFGKDRLAQVDEALAA